MDNPEKDTWDELDKEAGVLLLLHSLATLSRSYHADTDKVSIEIDVEYVPFLRLAAERLLSYREKVNDLSNSNDVRDAFDYMSPFPNKV